MHLLINKIKDIKIRKWYIKETIKNGWSYVFYKAKLKIQKKDKQISVKFI